MNVIDAIEQAAKLKWNWTGQNEHVKKKDRTKQIASKMEDDLIRPELQDWCGKRWYRRDKWKSKGIRYINMLPIWNWPKNII